MSYFQNEKNILRLLFNQRQQQFCEQSPKITIGRPIIMLYKHRESKITVKQLKQTVQKNSKKVIKKEIGRTQAVDQNQSVSSQKQHFIIRLNSKEMCIKQVPQYFKKKVQRPIQIRRSLKLSNHEATRYRRGLSDWLVKQNKQKQPEKRKQNIDLPSINSQNQVKSYWENKIKSKLKLKL